MKETYQCLAGDCDRPSLKASSHCEAISETYTPIFWGRKARLGKSLTVGEGSAILLNRLGQAN